MGPSQDQRLQHVTQKAGTPRSSEVLCQPDRICLSGFMEKKKETTGVMGLGLILGVWGLGFLGSSWGSREWI